MGSSGTLNSLGHTCLCLHFFQVVQPPVLPHLPFHTKQEQKRIESHKGWKSRNTMSVGELFYEYFKFYSEFNYATDAVSVKYGHPIPKNRVECQAGQKRFFIVQDFVDETDNIARNISERFLKIIQDEFRRGMIEIENGQKLRKIIEERPIS